MSDSGSTHTRCVGDPLSLLQFIEEKLKINHGLVVVLISSFYKLLKAREQLLKSGGVFAAGAGGVAP